MTPVRSVLAYQYQDLIPRTVACSSRLTGSAKFPSNNRLRTRNDEPPYLDYKVGHYTEGVIYSEPSNRRSAIFSTSKNPLPILEPPPKYFIPFLRPPTRLTLPPYTST